MVDSGTATPRTVNKLKAENNTLFEFVVSRKSTRYVQLGHVGSSSNSATRIYCHNHADHSTYCFIDVVGYVSTALVSPSGNYVAMLRSPELVNALYDSTATSIVGLTMVEIADVNNIRDNRSAFAEGDDSVQFFRWLDGSSDEFVYVTMGGRIVTGSAAAGEPGDSVLGTLDKQGLEMRREMDLSPDGQKMLITMNNGEMSVSGDNWWDVFLYDLSGQPVNRVTNTQYGFDPLWSPDGGSIFFKHGSPIANNSPGGAPTCTPHVAPATATSLALADASTLDPEKVPCIYDIYWASVG